MRIKDETDENLIALIKTIKPVCDKNKIPLILNDRPDIANLTNCAGVHIGPEDLPYEETRRIVGREAIVGVSCKESLNEAVNMAKKGANYVAFGAFYESPTKYVQTKVGPKTIKEWKTKENLPCVAIGGIRVDNCVPIINAGADFLAISSGIWQFPGGPLLAIQYFGEKLLAK